MKLGEWKELKEGEVIAVKGKVNKYIYAIVDGAAELSLDDVVPSVTVVAASAREKMAAMTKGRARLLLRNLPSNKNILRRGKFVGEMALSHGAAFGTVVVGKRRCKSLGVGHQQIERFCGGKSSSDELRASIVWEIFSREDENRRHGVNKNE